MALALENVSKHFGSLVAIKNLSLSFDAGSIYSIIGPNGAGKSTVVNMVAGSYTVTSGIIRLGSSILNKLPKYRIAQLGVARTYQNLRLFDGMTVLENLEVCFFPQSWVTILTGAKRLSKAERLHVCHACLEQFHLSDVSDVLAGDLPYGRQKMLELARAFVTEAPVVLLDEPAAGLNHTETKAMATMIASLKRNDRAIILVEHDMDMVMSISDRIDVLNYGELLCSGTPEQVRTNERVQEAYLGTTEELDDIRKLAQSRRAQGGLRSNAGIVRH
ncbi:ATP-binding cassette domain-containing protein [Phyllobacterium sp. SYP-B3895]|uniref:ABC transporter ATP-binding protein n=1 Tax=Phyllobacterium sp. SYP-B3895 TaxID=2663240 RepID=UPI0012999BCD|nr:ABC transporter ATP-binding protein [Phyllobacterium sp. SYP-B3895]MRG54033.1 ATP-binding cassette domain-containing protein [Phyllobacterium sp. SYP-B3895]